MPDVPAPGHLEEELTIQPRASQIQHVRMLHDNLIGMYVRQENEKVLRSYLICHPAVLFIRNSAPVQCQICQVHCAHICICDWVVHECCHTDLSCQGILQD